ncbi:unnamed protein product [Durusdinium trenchii]
MAELNSLLERARSECSALQEGKASEASQAASKAEELNATIQQLQDALETERSLKESFERESNQQTLQLQQVASTWQAQHGEAVEVAEKAKSIAESREQENTALQKAVEHWQTEHAQACRLQSEYQEQLTKREVTALEEQQRLQARLEGVLEDRAEAQAEHARSLELLRNQCQELRTRLSTAEEEHDLAKRDQVDALRSAEAQVEKLSAEQMALQRQVEEKDLQLQKKQEEVVAQQADLVQRSVLEDDLRQEKQDADNKIECLKEKARNLETELRDLQRKTEAQELAKLTAAAKAAQADEQLQQMETQVQELQREARVHVKLAEEQQVMISQQQLELAKLQQQLEEKQAAAKDPGDEERTRLLREGLAMAVEELDLRQANFCLEKQRLTGALEESRRLSMGYLGVTSASFDSAKVAGLEQQLASERQRSVQQAVSLQRLERQVMQQQMAKDQAEDLQKSYQQQAWRSQQLQDMLSEDLRKSNSKLAILEVRAKEVQECASMALEELITCKYESKFEVVRLRAALDELRSLLQKERLSFGGYLR